jgi:hypothetical protein
MAQRNVKETQSVPASEERWIIDRKYDGQSSFSIKETAEILGISTWHAWNAAKRGELPCISIGKRKIIPRVRLERLMNGS